MTITQQADTQTGVLAAALVALADHIAERQLPLFSQVHTPVLPTEPPYLEVSVVGVADQQRWLNTVHIDGQDEKPGRASQGMSRFTWHVRLPDTGTRIELTGLRPTSESVTS